MFSFLLVGAWSNSSLNRAILIATIDDSIAHFEIEKAKQQKKVFNIEDIRQRLNTIINLRDYKVSDEVIDMFVAKRICKLAGHSGSCL